MTQPLAPGQTTRLGTWMTSSNTANTLPSETDCSGTDLTCELVLPDQPQDTDAVYAIAAHHSGTNLSFVVSNQVDVMNDPLLPNTVTAPAGDIVVATAAVKLTWNRVTGTGAPQGWSFHRNTTAFSSTSTGTPLNVSISNAQASCSGTNATCEYILTGLADATGFFLGVQGHATATETGTTATVSGDSSVIVGSAAITLANTPPVFVAGDLSALNRSTASGNAVTCRQYQYRGGGHQTTCPRPQ